MYNRFGIKVRLCKKIEGVEMKWKRISDSKEKNKSLNKENTNILKDKLNNLYKSIKQTLKNVFKNE